MSRQRRLSVAEVAEIRRRLRLYRDNVPARIAADFGVSRQMIAAVGTGKYRPRVGA